MADTHSVTCYYMHDKLEKLYHLRSIFQHEVGHTEPLLRGEAT